MLSEQLLHKPPTASTRRAPPQEQPLDWRSLIIALRERLWLIIVFTAVGIAAGWAYLKRSQPMYEARATLEVEEKQRIMKFDEVSTDELRDISTMNTVAATVLSRTFLASLAAREKFQEKPGFFSNQTGAASQATVDDVVGVLAGSLTATVRKFTRLIDITARHANPDIAKEIANAAADGLIRFGLEQRAEVAGLANDFLLTEAKRLKAKLEASEMALQGYRDENKAFSLGDNQNLVVAQLNDINGKLSAATADRVQLESDITALKSYGTKPETAVNLRSVASHPSVAGPSQALAQKKSELAVLKTRYKPKHPKYIALQTEITDLEAQLNKAIPDVVAQIESTYESAKVNEQKYRDALAAQELKALDLDRLGVKFKVLQRDVESDKSMYQSVLERMKEVDLTKGMELNNLRPQEYAETPGAPSWPMPAQVLVASGGAGLGIGLALVYLIFFLDRSIKTVTQVESKLGLPVMAAVTMKKSAGRAGALQAWKEPHGGVAEAFRSLRAMATLLGREEERRSFLITSALPTEGKTFCSSNYALSLALQGKRTLLIDADLRRPSVSGVFFGKSLKPGLTEYLVGKASLDEAAHDTEVELLKVLPAGERSPNPAELLTGSAMKSLLEEALNHYDRVIIDTAPVVAVSDTLLIAPLVDTVFLVAQWGKTPMVVVQRAVDSLRNAGRSPSGIVLNKLPVNSRSHYYYYSPGAYGSEGVYGAPA